MRRTIRAILVSASVALGTFSGAQRTKPLQVFVGTKPVAFTIAQPIRRGSRVLIPLREVAEGLGWTVSSGPLGRSVALVQGSTRIVLPLTGAKATRNGIPLGRGLSPWVSKGRTLVPLRFFSEALKSTTAYNARRGVVQIFPHTAPKAATPTGPNSRPTKP